MYGCGKDCLILISFRLPQISCFTLSLKCFSSDSDSLPAVGIAPLLQFPNQPRAGPVLLTLLIFPLVPLSYKVLCGSIFSFPLVRYSCLLSAGVLHALLCIHGERFTPHPPTPPPYCSPLLLLIIVFYLAYYLSHLLKFKSLQMVTAAMKLKDAPWKKSYDKPRQH